MYMIVVDAFEGEMDRRPDDDVFSDRQVLVYVNDFSATSLIGANYSKF